MPTTCETCGEQELFPTELNMIPFNNSNRPSAGTLLQFRLIALSLVEDSNYAINCSCHDCAQSHCSIKIKKNETYCSKHTVNSLTPRQCKGDGGDEKSIYWSSCKDKVITADGYCKYHENQCAECPRRLASWDKYCFEHWNGYCKVIDCSERTPNSRDSNHYIFCAQHGNLYGNSLSNYQEKKREERQQSQQKATEQTKLKSLVKTNTTIAGEIKEVERFSTNWNKNLATVINSNGNYQVFLLVLAENRKVKEFPANASASKWGEHSRGNHNYLSDAQGEASWLRGMLNSNSNPILLVHPSCDSYTGFNSLVSEPYVKIDYSASTSDFKPLDIAWVEKKWGSEYQHVGVYIGNGELIEYTNNLGWEEALNSLPSFMRGGITRKTNWSGFLDKKSGNIHRYHPIIPFKDYKEIIGQLVWAKDNNFREGQYNLANRNCEHFSNMAVLGINYSKQVYDRKGDFKVKNATHLAGRGARTGLGIFGTIASVALAPVTGGASLVAGAAFATGTVAGVVDTVEKDRRGDFEINNGKGNAIKLPAEQQESKNILGQKSDSETWQLEARVEQAMPRYDESCRIM
jgi:hypothetical protein